MPFHMIFHTNKTPIRRPPQRPVTITSSTTTGARSYFTGSIIANATGPSCGACGK